MTDARRALNRLNGVWIYGSKLRMSLARYNTSSSFWRKKNVGEDSRVPPIPRLLNEREMGARRKPPVRKKRVLS